MTKRVGLLGALGTRTQQRHAQTGNRRHPRRRRNTGQATLHGRQTLLKGTGGWIGKPGVNVTLGFS